MAAGKVISDGEHAIDVGQVAAVVKSGTVNIDRWLLEVWFISCSQSCPMAFTSENERDEFFKLIVDAMG